MSICKSTHRLAVFAAAILVCGIQDRADAQTLYGSAGSLLNRENAVNHDWAYNWGIEPNNNPFDVNDANYEFVPMIWSATTGGQGLVNQINRVKNLEQNFGVHVDYLLGFNEPELSSQANMSVETAINAWDTITNEFENTDVKLVSPAVSGNGGINNWLTPFMDEVETRNADTDPNNDLQVDAIAYHFYTVAFNGANEAQKLIDQIDNLWNTYQRPIWITEFAGTSFSLDNPTHSVEERTSFNAAFLEALIPAFDARPYVERVAWWQFGALGQPYSRLSTQSGGVYTPTELGEIYSRTTLNPGESYNLSAGVTSATDVHFLKGGDLINAGQAFATALRAVDALEGDSSFGGSSDFAFEQADDAFIRVRSGATLRKIGGNSVFFPGDSVENSGTLRVVQGSLGVVGSPVNNSGLLSIEGGELLLQDGATVSGSGSIVVGAGGTLALGAASDTSPSNISQAVELNGGSIQSNPIASGSLVLSTTATLSGDAVFTGSGNLFVTGMLNAPTGGGGGGLIKEGNGDVLLARVNTYSGNTVVNGGRLRLGAGGTINNSPIIQVGPQGTLDVSLKFGGFPIVGQTLELSGEILGSINATADSMVEVLTDAALLNGDLSLVNSTAVVGMGEAVTMQIVGDYSQDALSVLALELLDEPTSDLVDIGGMATLAGTLEVAALAGFEPELGDSFTIVSADGGVVGAFDTVTLPTLGEGLFFVVDYGPNEVSLVVGGSSGDFDNDGVVDGSDFLAWQRGLGTEYDAGHLTEWQNAFNNAASAAIAVPEPTSATLLVVCWGILGYRRARTAELL